MDQPKKSRLDVCQILCIDIGGTAVKLGLLSQGELHELPELPTQAEDGAPRMIERIRNHVAELFPETEANYEDLPTFDAIGIATAGQVNTEDQSIRYANPNIPAYTGFPLRQYFMEAFGCDVRVENDVNAAALGELHFGAGRTLPANDRSFLCLTVGTGIGGATVIQGELQRGHYGGASEFGHLITHGKARQADPDDMMAGCLERYASTSALVKKASAYRPELTDGRKIFAHFDDPQVKKIIDDWIFELAMGLTGLVYVFGPHTIVFGGGIMREPYITEQLERELQHLIFPSFLPITLCQAELGSAANLWGAAVPLLDLTPTPVP